LGLLLIILGIILLVPIRYRVAVEHGEEFCMDGRAGWLFHFINAKVTQLEGKLHIRVRILWFTLFDNLKPKRVKIKKEKQKTIKRKKARTNVKTNNLVKSVVNNKSSDKLLDKAMDKSSDKATDKTLDKTIDESKNRTTNKSSDKATDKTIDKATDKTTDKALDIVSDTIQNKTPIISQNTRVTEQKPSEVTDNLISENKENFFQKLINRINRRKEKVIAFFHNLKNKIVKWFENILDLKKKVGLITDFLKNELNKDGFKLTFGSLKKLLKHILPTKLRSRLVFGTGDPCSTGQALGVMSFFYSVYGDKVQIIPDFENKILEGKHYARGRIRLVTLLIIVIKLILDKRFKRLKNNFQILKEEL
jgi:hypothetical protein